MRLAEGFVVDQEGTFGELKFSALRREVHEEDENGVMLEEIKERTYDLKSRGQGGMIQVSIPAQAGEKTFSYNEVVELVEPRLQTVATAGFPEVEVEWYLKADDLVKKGSVGKPFFKEKTEPGKDKQ